MSTRPASMPARLILSTGEVEMMRSVTSSNCLRVNSIPLSDLGSSACVCSQHIWARVSAVPEDTTAILWPSFLISLVAGASDDSTNCEHEVTADGCRDPGGKKRLVSRTAPILKLRANNSSRWSKTTISVEPPPMSIRIERLSVRGSACRTPR